MVHAISLVFILRTNKKIIYPAKLHRFENKRKDDNIP
jgi:hypothetical protein